MCHNIFLSSVLLYIYVFFSAFSLVVVAWTLLSVQIVSAPTFSPVECCFCCCGYHTCWHFGLLLFSAALVAACPRPETNCSTPEDPMPRKTMSQKSQKRGVCVAYKANFYEELEKAATYSEIPVLFFSQALPLAGKFNKSEMEKRNFAARS